jgi:peptide/nickel transport system substrate-binding protein
MGLLTLISGGTSGSRLVAPRPQHSARTVRQRTVHLLLGLGLVCTLGSCGGGTPSGGSNPGVLVYGSGGNPVTLESGNFIDGYSLMVADQIYDRLLKVKPGTTELEPALATEWKSSEGGKVWTFTLRSGVKFHDGTDFDAEAVKFNVERWWDADHPSRQGKPFEVWNKFFGGAKGTPDSLLEAVEVVNPTTITFRLAKPFVVFPSVIGSGYFGIASPTAVAQAGKAYGTPSSGAVGTGPFKFKEWKPNDRVLLEKNPNYWQAGLPKSNQLAIRIVPDPSARLAQLKAGQLDFTVALAPDQKKEIDADPNLQSLTRPSFNVAYLALNPSYKPFSDVRVRRAVAYAINRPQLVQAFWGELGRHDPHFLPEVFSWAHSAAIAPYPYDPEKAKQLLKEAGFANGFDLELYYMPVSRDYYPTPKPVAEAFLADLSAVGIRVTLKTKDWAAYLADRNKPPGYQAFMLGWVGDYGDPDNFYYPLFAPNSTADLGGWKNEQIAGLLDQARATADQKQRAKLYAQVDEILHREVVRLPIAHSEPLVAKRKSLEGWTPSPLGTEPFDSISKSGGAQP